MHTNALLGDPTLIGILGVACRGGWPLECAHRPPSPISALLEIQIQTGTARVQ